MFSDPIPPKAASAILGVTEVCLSKWRRAGTGPSWTERTKTRRDRSRYLYSRAEVQSFAHERKHRAENCFRQRVAEIVAGTPGFGIPDLRDLMTVKGHGSIQGIPAKERDSFLSALVEAAMSGGGHE